MLERIDLRKAAGRLCALPAGFVALVWLGVAIAENAHDHDHAEHTAPCAICAVGYQGMTTMSAAMAVAPVAGLHTLHSLSLPNLRIRPATGHRIPRRSRAPPLFISR